MDKAKINKWLDAIIYEDGAKMSSGSVRTIELIRKEAISPSPTGDRDCEELKKEVERLKGLIKSAHYAGWYNGMVNAYKHEFSWDEFSKTNNL